jgi:hypothetical protein
MQKSLLLKSWVLAAAVLLVLEIVQPTKQAAVKAVKVDNGFSILTMQVFMILQSQ